MTVSRDEAGSKPLTGVGVLVVEDDFLICMELESVLSEAGARIVGCCRSLAEALGFIVSRLDGIEGPVVGLLDLRLGKDSSLPAAQALRSRGVPFLFYSGQGGMKAVQDEWAGTLVIPKPALPGEIIAAVASLVPAGRG